MVAYKYKKDCNCYCPSGGCIHSAYARNIRVTNFVTPVGSERSFSLDGSYSQRWKAGLSGLAPGVYYMQAFDIEAHAPEVEDDTWAGFLPITSVASVPYMFLTPAVGMTVGGVTQSGFTEDNFSGSLAAPSLPELISPHFATSPINAIFFPLEHYFGANLRVWLHKFSLIKDGVVQSKVYDGPTNYVTNTDSTPTAKFKRSIFDVPVKPTFSRGVKYGLRIWLKLQIMATTVADLYVGVNQSYTPAQAGTRTDISHGQALTYMLFNVNSNPTYRHMKHSYQFEYVGGTERPLGANIVRFWQDSGNDPSAPNSGYYSNRTWLNECNACRVRLKPSTSFDEGIGLSLLTEVPVAFIQPASAITTIRLYVPEDSLDYIKHFRYNTLGGTLTYTESENPGGTWNCKDPKTFVPFVSLKTNTTGIFTPTTFPISAPTSIIVSRIPY